MALPLRKRLHVPFFHSLSLASKRWRNTQRFNCVVAPFRELRGTTSRRWAAILPVKILLMEAHSFEKRCGEAMSQRGILPSRTFGVRTSNKSPDIGHASLSRTSVARPEQTDAWSSSIRTACGRQ